MKPSILISNPYAPVNIHCIYEHICVLKLLWMLSTVGLDSPYNGHVGMDHFC